MTNQDKTLATGQWYSKRDCPDNPKRVANGPAAHCFQNIKRRRGLMAGESFITSKCKHCGGLIVDCPTIFI